MKKTKEQGQQKEEKKNKPVKKFRAGAIEATVWKNSIEREDGGKSSYPTVSFQRNYKDKDGEWQTTSSLRRNDLPKASLVLKKAYEFISMGDFNENSKSFKY